MKKLVLIPLLIVLVVALIFGGCAAPTPTPTEEMNIRFSHWWPSGSRFETDIFIPMFEDLKRKTNGRIGYTLFAGGSLNAPADAYDAVARGLADMAFMVPTFDPGRFPLTDMLSLPLSYPDGMTERAVGMPVFDKILYKEYPDVKPLAIYPSSRFRYTGTKEVRTLEDMKGLKIRSAGGLFTRSIEALGAEAIFMPYPDVYLALQTGVIDGVINAADAMIPYKHQELVTWVVEFGLGGIPVGTIVNKDFWEKIPDELKPAVADVGWDEAYYHASMVDDTYDADWALIAETATIYTLPPDEKARWKAALKPMVGEWIAEMEAKGLPGEEAVALLKEEYEKQGMTWPF